MSASHRVHGAKILKAVSSPLRLQILNLLFDKGPLSYTELLSSLKMNPSRDAGRFAYHLKFLLKADLIEADSEARKYCLTELGTMVIDIAERIDKKVFKPKNTLVRTSRFTFEEFDTNKIASSLTKEARMPAELAQKVAKEAEKQLLQSKTKYLTAPLVREVVNAILVEKGLEEYRHKLTRLGVPVHDVTTLLECENRSPQRSTSVLEAAGEAVLKEYMLLNKLPRDIADAHLSGTLHISGLSSWILKPAEIMHDIRFFLQSGLNLEKIEPNQPSIPPPRDLESALSMIFNVVLRTAKEIAEAQTIDYFNVFLAPFIKNIEPSIVRNALHRFVLNLAQQSNVSIGVEITVPQFIKDKPAIGSNGEPVGKYGDFTLETQLLGLFLLETFAENSLQKPLSNPKLIVKLRPQTFQNMTHDELAEKIVTKAHMLAADRGIPFFAKVNGENEQSSFSSSGCRLGADLSGDLEIDTLRTGCLGTVTVNTPRIVYESGKDETKLLEILKERIEMANRALEIKFQALKENSKGLLPFISQEYNGDQYFRIENCSRIVNFAGFKEAAEAFCEKDISSEKTQEFAEKMAKDIAALTRKIGRRREKRVYPAVLPCPEASERLAQVDIEKYGIARVRFSGTRERPYYSTTNRVTLTGATNLQKELVTLGRLGGLNTGGSVVAIDLKDEEYAPSEIIDMSKLLTMDSKVDFFTFNRRITYCANCKKSWFGLLHKCPKCGAVSALVFFDRFASMTLALDFDFSLHCT